VVQQFEMLLTDVLAKPRTAFSRRAQLVSSMSVGVSRGVNTQQ
jgi:hypothetical protein